MNLQSEQQQQMQHGPVNKSQYQFLLPSQSNISHQNPVLQQHYQQHQIQQNLQPQQLYQFQQHQQIPATNRIHRQPSVYNPSVMPPFATPSTPTLSQSQPMNMILSSTTSSNTGFIVAPHQFHRQSTMAGQMYPNSHLVGMSNTGNQLAYPFMTLTGDSRGGIQHPFQHQQQQQQQRSPLPPYISAQLDQGIQHHFLGPRWTHPGNLPSPYHQPISQNVHPQYRLREQQMGQRLTYPSQKNSMDLPSNMFGIPPAHLNLDGSQFHHTPPYSLQQLRGPCQLNQTALQSMPPQNQQGLQSPISVEHGVPANHMDLSLQQKNTLDMTVAGALSRSNKDINFDYKTGSPNNQREMGLVGHHAIINMQENYQHVMPLRHPYSSTIDSSSSPCQSPFISAPSSPLSTPPPASPASNSEYIKKLLMELDLTKRISMCDHFIRNITADMTALEEETLKRMSGPESFYSTSECWEMQRRKEEMVKEKRKLEAFKEKQNCQVNQFYKGIESSSREQEIYYPPDINTGGPSVPVPTTMVNNCTDIPSMNVTVQDTKKQLNVIVDNSEVRKSHLLLVK